MPHTTVSYPATSDNANAAQITQ